MVCLELGVAMEEEKEGLEEKEEEDQMPTLKGHGGIGDASFEVDELGIGVAS